MEDYLKLALGLLCAGIGGELFLRSTIGLARWMRVSPAVVGATIAAFATSSPELAISISSATAGHPQISLGDALGSNVVNIALILALVLIMGGLHSKRETIKREFTTAMLAPVLVALLLLDGTLSRLDGLFIIGLFSYWLVIVGIEAHRQTRVKQVIPKMRDGWLVSVLGIVGLLLLALSGYLIVTGAKNIALAFGISEFIIGATIVALGTSIPELATSIIARVKGLDDISLGLILGSNIFNGLFIIGIAAIIYPINAPLQDVVMVLVFGLLAVALTYPTSQGALKPSRGAVLLVLYAVYIALAYYQH